MDRRMVIMSTNPMTPATYFVIKHSPTEEHSSNLTSKIEMKMHSILLSFFQMSTEQASMHSYKLIAVSH